MATDNGTVSIDRLLSGETAVDFKELQKLLSDEDSSDAGSIAVKLEDLDVRWGQFYEHTNKNLMIVTPAKTGR